MLQLKQFPDIPVSTQEEARESRPHPEELRFRHLAREEGSFPCVVGKKFPAFPSPLKRRRSPQERREELHLVPPFPESPRCLSPFQGTLFSLHCLDFQAEDRHRHTPWWHVGQPFGKATRERHRSLDPCEEKRDTAATAREESARACRHSARGLTPWGDSRSTPRSMSALERNPQVPAPTPHKVLGPGIDGTEIPKGSRATRMGTGLS